MFSNYFFLKRLASALREKIVGLSLIDCFSQNKNELIIGLASESTEFWIRASLDPNISIISFPDTIARARKNSVDLFPVLRGSKVIDCSVFKFDRSFKIAFEKDRSLIFKMHGRRANVLLEEENSITEIFQNSLSNDLALDTKNLNKEIKVDKEAFVESDFTPTTLIPALGKEVQSFWDAHFSHLPDSERWSEFQKLLDQLETNPIFLDNAEAKLSLLPMKDAEETTDPIVAANWLHAKRTRSFYFDREKAQVKSQLEGLIKKTENYIFKTSEKLRLVQAQRSPEELANIIMANLSLINQGLSKVVLNDMYTNDFIEIKLNPKLSPQKNAENLYRKSKNRYQEISMFQKNIEEKHQKISSLNHQIAALEAVENSKELKQFLKSTTLGKSKETTEKNKPYHKFEKDDWTILVGKNAKANDELTLKVATKNDLWLHAKDVSGSHVVIKEKPGQNFPIHIIEFAAGLAAFNSKRKTDSLCPVIYTPKKFVRKPKGSLPGAVVVEKEEVLMIEPRSVE
ncbi:MAG: NFACT RNA binding domain-containing protein [Cyclobacteriaceae bacterium]